MAPTYTLSTDSQATIFKKNTFVSKLQSIISKFKLSLVRSELTQVSNLAFTKLQNLNVKLGMSKATVPVSHPLGGEDFIFEKYVCILSNIFRDWQWYD